MKNRGILPAAIISFIVLVPSLIWIILDKSLWLWDQSWYGQASVDLWSFLVNGEYVKWLDLLTHAFRIKAPAIAWFGQFFVPLHLITGSIESALLLEIFIANFVTLAVVYLILVRISRLQTTMLTVILFIAGSPLFVGMSHQYFVEPLQAMLVSVCVFVVMRATTSNAIRSTILFSITSILAMAVKISSPLYLVVPGLVIVYIFVKDIKQSSRTDVLRKIKSAWWLLVAIMFTAIPVITWYVVNWDEQIRFLRATSSGDVAVLYGHDATISEKLHYWLTALFHAFFLQGTAIIVVTAIIIYFILQYFVVKDKTAHRWSAMFGGKSTNIVAMAIVSIGITLYVFAFQKNEETRYLLPVLPYMAILIAKALDYISENKILAYAVLCAGFVQFVSVHAYTLGFDKMLTALTPRNTWAQISVNRDASNWQMVQLIVDNVCTSDTVLKTNIIGVDLPWLNANAVSFLSDQKMLENNQKCFYTSLGYAEKKPDRAIERMLNVHAPYIVFPDDIRSIDHFGDYTLDQLNAVSANVVSSENFQSLYKKVLPDPSPVIDLWVLTNTAAHVGG